MKKDSYIFFSVVIPLYNKEKYIAQTIASVFQQSFTNFEIIIINDGSTDDSVGIVEQLKDDSVQLFHQKNKGVAAARNYGISLAKGTHVAFLDADDLWLPEHLQNFVNGIHIFPTSKIFFNNYSIQLKNCYNKEPKFSNQVNASDIFKSTNFFKNSLYHSAWTSSVCIAIEVLKKQFLFNINLKASEDTDFWIRLGMSFKPIFNKNRSAIILKNFSSGLSKSKNLLSRTYILFHYLEEEKKDIWLKKYMDNNRFAIALEAKLEGELQVFRKIVKHINPKNLNIKQKIILRSPKFGIALLKRCKHLLTKFNIHLGVYG